MNTSDQIAAGALIVSLVSLLVTVIVGIVAYRGQRRTEKSAERANEMAEHANNLAAQANIQSAGDAETAMRSAINAEWQKFNDLKGEMDAVVDGKPESKWTADEKRKIKALENRMRFALEIVLNSFESACGRYLDPGKCDKVRFKKHFHDDIRKLVKCEIPLIAEVLKPGPASNYQAVMKVFDEWHNLEK
jgi:hypothetical protein